MTLEGLQFARKVSIPLRGSVALTETEKAVVETADFQRLQGVRQLGTVVWAYPTATHTRYEHSLGTLAKADEMLVEVVRSGTRSTDERDLSIMDLKLTRMYALLHDISHVPFSHTIEDEFGLFASHGKNLARTERFLGANSEIGAVLRRMEPAGFYDRLMAIYLWEDDPKKREERGSEAWEPLRQWLHLAEDDAFVRDIVSNGVCADVLDYCERDAHYCGVDVADFGLTDWIYLKRATETDSGPAKHRVFLGLEADEKGNSRPGVVEGLVSLLQAGDVLSKVLYYHDSKLSASVMLARAVQEYHERQDDESYLYHQSDDGLVASICDWEREMGRTGGGESPIGLATLIRDGTLHRPIAAYDAVRFEGDESVCRHRLPKTGAVEQLSVPCTRREVENWLAAKIGHRCGAVLVHPPLRIRSPKAISARVEWRCVDTTLGEIDEPVAAARLHRWRTAGGGVGPVRLFGSRDVSGEDVRTVTRAFEEWVSTTTRSRRD